MTKPSASRLLLLLLGMDFVFIFLHVIVEISDPNPSACNIVCDYMNIYHLVKIFGVILLFAYILRLTRHSGYAAWMFMFIFFLFDDALLLHQKVGDRLAVVFNTYFFPTSGLPTRYFELAVLAIAGIILLANVAWAFYHGDSTFRKISMDLVLFIAALVFFGLIVDIAELLNLGQAFLLETVEDGGELVVYSLIVWYVFRVAIHPAKQGLFRYDLLFRHRG